MNEERFHHVLRALSLREGIPEEEVLKEMEAVIGDAYRAALCSGDPEKLEMWRKIAPDGKPSACAFVSCLAELLRQEDSPNFS